MIKGGDGYTRFFHLSTKARGRVNRIDHIKEDGVLLNDLTEIQDAAVRYFSNLFHPSPSVMDGSLFNIEGPTVMAEQNSILASLPTEEEN